MHGLHLSKYYMQQLAYACLHDLTSLSYDSEDDKLARKLLLNYEKTCEINVYNNVLNI